MKGLDIRIMGKVWGGHTSGERNHRAGGIQKRKSVKWVLMFGGQKRTKTRTTQS